MDGACPAGKTEVMGIVAFVNEQVTHATDVFEESRRGLNVAATTRGQRKRTGPAGGRMDLCMPAAPRPPDRLRRTPLPFTQYAAL